MAVEQYGRLERWNNVPTADEETVQLLAKLLEWRAQSEAEARIRAEYLDLMELRPGERGLLGTRPL